MPAFVPLMPLNGKALGDLGRASGYFEAIFKMLLLAMALSGAVTPWFGPASASAPKALASTQLVQPPAPAPARQAHAAGAYSGPVMLARAGSGSGIRQSHWADRPPKS